MTLRNLETYGYIGSKTKSYQIQREFFLLFIFLGHRGRAFWPYAIRPSQCYSAPRLFRRFHSMDYATEFHQNLDTVCIIKALDQDPSQQLSRAFSLLSPPLVASNNECPKATSLQPASLMEESNRHQGAVLRYVQRAMHFNLVTEVLKTWYL